MSGQKWTSGSKQILDFSPPRLFCRFVPFSICKELFDGPFAMQGVGSKVPKSRQTGRTMYLPHKPDTGKILNWKPDEMYHGLGIDSEYG